MTATLIYQNGQSFRLMKPFKQAADVSFSTSVGWEVSDAIDPLECDLFEFIGLHEVRRLQEELTSADPHRIAVAIKAVNRAIKRTRLRATVPAGLPRQLAGSSRPAWMATV